MSSDLVIVYHRQPYEEVQNDDGTVSYVENKSPNGIVPTLKSFFGRFDKGAWVAWKEAEDTSNPGFERVIEIEDRYGKYSVSRLPLTAEQVKSFYHVTSKEAFWPILHSFKERYNYDPVDWPTFREVNWNFAEAAAAEAAEGANVWVHDYNLWLVPGYLRQMRPDLKISFFHHTPFPAADTFNVLPWRKEIVQSLLACDIIGFHIPRYAANFVQVARSLFDVETSKREKVIPEFASEVTALSERTQPVEISFEGRKIVISSSPVGVDVDYIDKLARSEKKQERVKALKEDFKDEQLILSVGRTDYTKGSIEQLLSYERLLENHKELRGKVRLLHVSVPANANMTAYQEIQEAIESIAGRINGRFGSLEWQPLALISRPIPFEDLIAYYRVADVAWITPLADGMNLVAKEYVASRIDDDGVLVLSEFAGAAVEMGSAVLVNPFSNKSMDSGIFSALNMPGEERKARMEALRGVVAKYDIRYWAESQMALFGSPKAAPSPQSTQGTAPEIA
ncbi:Glucosylglycerol-phosphate synthase [Aquimixticola soesokkakensis]|uniref:Glucosylglycerol-phosphate synthase n=1 Tax=Aquimixticola soesokkakensis TaxID=1519096 RepID=A0A1Y5TFF7_9RHOB|nr:glucosylglycerol-phosphate synthase [Aquimixticola soesokkakensis]SLN59080.1 Glucosylglycerol-phosphate synthase [Aquimixticola soesokkakensis]